MHPSSHVAAASVFKNERRRDSRMNWKTCSLEAERGISKRRQDFAGRSVVELGILISIPMPSHP